ncbi:MFS transporter [Meridianimarinicoccus aquatilis]|uniref:MFS transporter n=2 Tax=Meridianimarinicoccus aquatilis TaxID=2552766 RepID=A0A4R6AY94_9RHOB|nr:MFS transporter [Fluviibacterium aquatile]
MTLQRMSRRRIWGWYCFDWASQPYNTLLLTFIFAPYLKEVLGEGTAAQSAWGYGVGTAGLLIAILAPLLGSMADRCGPHMRLRFIWIFSGLYIIGASGLWWTMPGDPNLIMTLLFFGVGLIGMEFATIFTNAMMPDLAPRAAIGRISGAGWAFGYLGGLMALVMVLALLAENSATGKTLIGSDPILGLDAHAREGTRAVGPFTALWYAIFMIPFFAWVREMPPRAGVRLGQAARQAWPDLRKALRTLPGRRSLTAFLAASMLYRDALNGIYFFGGIYAAGVLGWSVVEVGVFGILAVISAALFAWLGGLGDTRFGPKPIIAVSILTLVGVTLAAIFVSRSTVFGIAVLPESFAPDIAFFAIGAVIGGAGGALQASSRCMLVFQVDPSHITQGFGLYALTGKATAFVAPFAVALATDISGSQQMGIAPLLALFLFGLILLVWVKPYGETQI